MIRSFVEFLSAVDDSFSVAYLTGYLFIAAIVTGLLWYFWPRWIPRRLPRWRMPAFRRPSLRRGRWRLPRWDWRALFRRRKRKRAGPDESEKEPVDLGDELPELPVEAFVSLADRLAAEGRYAEAVRERLRAIVRDLVLRGAIEHRPGWTVTELATAASRALPPAKPPIDEATLIFSEIWYAERAATAQHDGRMRALTAQLTAVPIGVSPATARTDGSLAWS